MPDKTSRVRIPEGKVRMISIRARTFLLAAAVAFVAVALALVLLYRQQALTEAIRSQEAQNVVLTRVLANALWPRFAGHVKAASPEKLEDLRGGAAALEFNKEIAEAVRDTPVHRVKVYNVAGLTVFSSNPGQIGESRANHPPFRRTVDQQVPVSTMSFRANFTGFARAMTSVHLVETYVPVEVHAGGIEGIFELYTEANAAMERVRAATIRFGAIVVAGLGFLYAGLVYALRRGVRSR